MERKGNYYCDNCNLILTNGDEVEVQFESYYKHGHGTVDYCFNCMDEIDEDNWEEGWEYHGGFNVGEIL